MKSAIVNGMMRTVVAMSAKSSILAGMLWLGASMLLEAGAESSSTWPQDYSVKRDNAAGTLVLDTPFYAIEHDLKTGGVISRITLAHGKAANLLVRPIATRVRDETASCGAT